MRTGSLYNIHKVFEQLVPPDTWFTQEVIAYGDHIIIKVNGKVITDFVDEKNTYRKGYLALQGHDPKSTTYYRNLMFRRLPSSGEAKQ